MFNTSRLGENFCEIVFGNQIQLPQNSPKAFSCSFLLF